MENLLQQAKIALQNGDLQSAENFYYQACKKALLNIDFDNVFSCLQKILEIFPNEFKAKICRNYFEAFSSFLTENQENQYLSNLQNALQKQQNKNINLSFIIAKILIYQAQATPNLDAEYQKLLQAKNIILSLNFDAARFLKIQIELLLAQNQQNQQNQQNSTRNSKNFSKDFYKNANIIWEKNQQRIRQKFPNLALSADESKEFANIKITAFFSNGRAGSLFVHSLLDGYPKIATLPSYSLRYYFDPEMLDFLFPADIFENPNWKQNLIEKFCQTFAMMFDGDAICDHINGFGKFIGFCEMGENGNEILRVSKTAFGEFMLNELKNREKISATAFFILVHYAYEFALGRLGRLKQSQKNKQQKTVIFYNVHIFDSKYLQNFCYAFPKAQYLSITREPLNMLEASINLYMNALDPLTAGTALANIKPYDILEHGGKNLFITWQKLPQIFYLPYLIGEVFFKFGFAKSATIRLEDIKNNPKTALLNLLTWLGVENPIWHQSLEIETFADFLYAGATQNRVKGFDNSHLKKGQGTFFSKNDLRIMNLMAYPLAVKFGYRQKDDEYLQKEIAWYENEQKIETYMDFEIKIIDRLKQDFPNEISKMMTPYYHRIKLTKQNLNYIKKHKENYFGYTDLLEL